jgi:glycosyltransferase involved in cell wall biosynthesis
MNIKRNRTIQLVITFALKKEVPRDWLESHNVPVVSISALKSGALSRVISNGSGILAVITGSGPGASEEAAHWINNNVLPYFVLNIGTCGLIKRDCELGKWISPKRVVNEAGEELELDRPYPIPITADVLNVSSLISVNRASVDISQRWEAHDAVDMECFAQAKVFNEAETSFHSLKFTTDYSDRNTETDFNKNISLFEQAVKGILNFLQDSMGKVSVVVPVYNRGKTIVRALDSILEQSMKPEEIIVVNDGSSDGTADVIKEYGNRITIINMPQNSGPSAARNEGVKYSQSEWIAFLDSDDCWEKDKLKSQKEYLDRYPFYQIMQSEEVWIRKGKRVNPCKHHEKKSGWIWGPSLHRCLVSPSGVMLKKSLFEQYGGFDENLPVCEDYDLWLKISRDNPVGLDSTMSVIKYGGHSDQLSHKFPAMDRFRVKSLVAGLKNEEDPYFRQKIIAVLREKLSILIQGCEKRGKHSEADEYISIVESLRD